MNFDREVFLAALIVPCDGEQIIASRRAKEYADSDLRLTRVDYRISIECAGCKAKPRESYIIRKNIALQHEANIDLVPQNMYGRMPLESRSAVYRRELAIKRGPRLTFA
jgi:hypothetical protein